MDNVYIFLAKYFFVASVLIIAWVWLRQKREIKIGFAVAAILAGIIALIISRIAGKLYYDPRPFVTQNVVPLIKHAADNGFPSDHALLTSNLAVVTYMYSKKWGWVAFVVAILVGIGRVMVHVHSPIDIVGAWVIGIVSAWAGVYLARRIFSDDNRLEEIKKDPGNDKT